jgi:hypothetical protein
LDYIRANDDAGRSFSFLHFFLVNVFLVLSLQEYLRGGYYRQVRGKLEADRFPELGWSREQIEGLRLDLRKSRAESARFGPQGKRKEIGSEAGFLFPALTDRARLCLP